MFILYDSSFDFKIYLGFNFTSQNPSKAYYYESNEAYIHPKYALLRVGEQDVVYDLGLIKLNQFIVNISGVNSICLPEKWRPERTSALYGDIHQYVMVSGWGRPPFRQGGNRLKMAEWRLSDIRWPRRRLSNVHLFKIAKQGVCPVRLIL